MVGFVLVIVKECPKRREALCPCAMPLPHALGIGSWFECKLVGFGLDSHI